MIILSFLTYTASLLFLFFGVQIFLYNRKVYLNKLFLFLFSSFFIWSIGNSFLIIAPDKALCWFWFRIASIGACLSPSIMLHFSLVYLEKYELLKKFRLYTFLYLSSMVFISISLLGKLGAYDFIKTGIGWSKVNNSDSVLFYIFYLYVLFATLSGMLMIIARAVKLNNIREKRKHYIIGISGTVSIVIAGMQSVLFPQVFALTPVSVVIFGACAWYSIFRHQQIDQTFALVSGILFNTIADSVIILNAEGKIIDINPETTRLLGYNKSELEGKSMQALFNAEESLYSGDIIDKVRSCPIRNYETVFAAKNGKHIPVVFTASENTNKKGDFAGVTIISRDISERKSYEERLKYVALHDTLTGLPNRMLFNDRLSGALLRAQRGKSIIAVMLLDLDRFKEINDALGHDNGDILLKDTSRRLQMTLRESDTIARLGGDEFVIVAENLKNIEDASNLAKKILLAFQEPFIIKAHEIFITVSIGVSTYPYHAGNPDVLVKNADLAMYHAKSAGKNNYQMYTVTMSMAASEKAALENSLRKAIERNELLLYYQPIIDVNTMKLAGMEALLRWRHSEFGIIPPAKFIPLAEETGLIIGIGEWVLRTACIQCKTWQEAGFPDLSLSINISANQFRQDNISERILNILGETDFNPSLLEIEITESTAMQNFEKTVHILQSLKNYGIRTAIDDFGTGYSSLNYLGRFPIHSIKIDRMFTKDITSNTGNSAIVRAIYAMACSMNLGITAEGVETAEQLKYFHSLKDNYPGSPSSLRAQGYLFSKPLPAGEFNRITSDKQYFYIFKQ